jgi:DNA-binding response OmpR family regulator
LVTFYTAFCTSCQWLLRHWGITARDYNIDINMESDKSNIIFIGNNLAAAQALSRQLQPKGVRMAIYLDYATGMLQALHNTYVLMIIDCKNQTGFDVCRRLRARGSHIAILALLDHYSDTVVSKCASFGIDNYIAEPHSLYSLAQQVLHLLRRRPTPRLDEIELEQLKINKSAREVQALDQNVPLQKREYEILLMLAENRGRVVRRELLHDATSPQTRLSNDNTIDVHISKIRKKLRSAGINYNLIDTVYGVGYKLK